MARTHASRAYRPDYSEDAGLTRFSLDHATLLGLFSGFGLLFGAMVLGGSVGSFLDLRSFLIVAGGTLGITTMCYSLRDMARTPRVIAKALTHSIPDVRQAAHRMLELADIARKQGLLELDRLVDGFDDQPFVRKALTLTVDGTPTNEISTILERDVDEMVRRHMNSAGILRKAAEVAPAMGLIGTLIGLVQMLGNLEDPSAIGPSMAVALLTTFYGAVLATMVFAPLAAKLERNSSEEIMVANVYVLTAQSICRKENPRRLEMMLNSMLPPNKRVQHFD